MTPAPEVTITVPPDRADDMRRVLVGEYRHVAEALYGGGFDLKNLEEEEFCEFMRSREWLRELDDLLSALGWREAAPTDTVSVTLDADRLATLAGYELQIGERFEEAAGRGDSEAMHRMLAEAEWWGHVRDGAEQALGREKVAA